MILLIDDDHNGERLQQFCQWFGEDQIVHATNAKDGYDRLIEKPWDIVFLDHDLGEGPGDMTMMQLADKIAEEGLQKDADFIVHSMNPVGAESLKNTLKRTHNISVVSMRLLAERLKG